MSSLKRLLVTSVIGGAWNTVILAMRRFRLHPLARIEDCQARLKIERGSKIGPGCVVGIGREGAVRIGKDCWFYRDVELRSEGQLAASKSRLRLKWS